MEGGPVSGRGAPLSAQAITSHKWKRVGTDRSEDVWWGGGVQHGGWGGGDGWGENRGRRVTGHLFCLCVTLEQKNAFNKIIIIPYPFAIPHLVLRDSLCRVRWRGSVLPLHASVVLVSGLRVGEGVGRVLVTKLDTLSWYSEFTVAILMQS